MTEKNAQSEAGLASDLNRELGGQKTGKIPSITLKIKDSCRICKFWDWHGDDMDVEGGNYADGWCKRYPPVRNLEPENIEIASYNLWSFPSTLHHWWCGEFKSEET